MRARVYWGTPGPARSSFLVKLQGALASEFGTDRSLKGEDARPQRLFFYLARGLLLSTVVRYASLRSFAL